MKNITVILLFTSLMSGCSATKSLLNGKDKSTVAAQEETMPLIDIKPVERVGVKKPNAIDADRVRLDSFGAASLPNGDPLYAGRENRYESQQLTKNIGSYAQNLAQNLVSNMEYVSDKTAIGITSFVLLDGDLQQTNLLGLQLAESFVHEMHKFRIPVVDYKATDYIRVTEDGDFFLSRDFLELKNKAALDYILTGTMVKHRGGYLVNARIIGMKSKAVVATAQSLIPFYVADALLPSSGGRNDGVKLIQGDQ
jgi:TolB-like protein